jgi:hypothetical protein
MNRRGFLGSVIGLLVTSQLPFKAKRPDYITPFQDRKLRFWNLSEEQLRKCRISVITNKGEFLAPGIASVEKTESKIVLKCEPLLVNQHFTTLSVNVIDDENYVVMNQRFAVSTTLTSGDKLYVISTTELYEEDV